MHGRRQAWAKGGTCPPPPLEMRKWVFVTVTNCTLEYLNRQQLYLYCTVLCRLSCIQLYSIDNFVEEAGLWYEVWANRVNEVDSNDIPVQCSMSL